MTNSVKKQKMKTKMIVLPMIALVIFIAVTLVITFNDSLLYLSSNSVVNKAICPNGYNLSDNKCRITTSAIKKGDVNIDGKIDELDISIIQNHIMGVTTLVDDNLKIADVSGDGKVTVKDVNKVKLYYRGITGDITYTCLNDYELDGKKCYKDEKIIHVTNGDYNKYEAVLYNGDYWYIIGLGEDYITMLKSKPLESSELSNYTIDNNLVYYKDSLQIKNILNSYIKDIESDLKEVDGAKIRLLNINDLKDLGYIDKTGTLYFEESSNTPYWIRINGSSYFIDNNASSFILTEYNNKSYVYKTDENNTLGLIRPVINVYKDKIN